MVRTRITPGSTTVFAALLVGLCLQSSPASAQVEFWLTDPGGSARFEKQASRPGPGQAGKQTRRSRSTRQKTYQTIDGFGYTLTGGSAGLHRPDGPRPPHAPC